MTNLFDKLNLRPFERRLIVIVGIILFVVVQIWFVWPHFGDLAKMNARRAAGLATLKQFNAELAQKDKFQAEVAKLEGQGLAVPNEDQASDLLRAIEQQARNAQVMITVSGRPTIATNQFFLERSQQITTLSTEDGLINFLFNLGAGNSLIRVRELSLRPDPTRLKLNANIKLVASYQKNPVRAAAPAATNAAPPRPAPAPAPVAQSSTPKKKTP